MNIEGFEAEVGVLGTILMTPAAFGIVTAEGGLRSEHFASHGHRIIFAEMESLSRNGTPIDKTVLIEHGIDPAELALEHQVVDVLNVSAYAAIVVDKHRWRLRAQAGQAIAAAAEREDEDSYAQAEAMLGAAAESKGGATTFTAEQLGSEFFDFLGNGGVESIPFPFEKLNRLASGGMRRGGLTLIGGHTSHGKSVLIDQTLESAAVDGHLCHLYINEMDHRERTARTLARRTGLPADRIIRDDLTMADKERILPELGRLPFGITDAFGWSALDIARHARHHRYDVVAVDLLHGVTYPAKNRAEGLGEVSRELKRLAGVADCHVLATVHLNEARVLGVVRPEPTLGDIRDSGQPKNDADNVIFVHRDQDEQNGYPTREGLIYLSKCRGGQLGGVFVVFDGEHMRFRERVPSTTTHYEEVRAA